MHFRNLILTTKRIGIAVGLVGAVATPGHAAPPVADAQVVADAVTVADIGHNAFGRAVPNLDPAAWERMHAGKRVFVRTWRPAGDGAGLGGGLGPLYNAPSCTSCHFKDGRGGPRATPQPPPPVLLRLDSRRGRDSRGWGRQLQDHAVRQAPEGSVGTDERTVVGYYADGEAYVLRTPSHHVRGVAPRLPVSPRIPPTLIGVGLLEAVPTDVIVAWADPDDRDSDGISGRPRWVEETNGRTLGRFGWKADQPTLASQVAAALAEDMGVSTVHRLATLDDQPEMTAEDFDLLIDYLRFLAPPAPRAGDPSVLGKGKAVFDAIGCTSCHRPELTTTSDVETLVGETKGHVALAARTIHPYTDLLLHDLGPELADDGIGDVGAEPNEWRTAPLWGLGLMETVNGALYLMHDGRARTFEEAILWHGGEAQASRERFRSLARDERNALVVYLRSL